MIKAKSEYSKHGPYDEFYTPFDAVEMIIPFIPDKVTRIWECTAVKESKIVSVLRENGYSVITTHIETGYDFLKYEPTDYDLILSNPPYSIKDKFLKRAFELERPFMFLLPSDAIGGIERNKLFRKYGTQILVPDKRFEFSPDKKHGVWFHTSWFTWGLGLEKDLYFIPIKVESHSSIERHYTYTSILDYFSEFCHE